MRDILKNCVYVYVQKMVLRHWSEYGDEKTRINYLNEKRFVDTVKISSAGLKDKFLF